MAIPQSIFISAGEASGDTYGALLIEALKKQGVTESFGLGGLQMRDSGCDTVVESREVAVVGLAEVVRHLPAIYARFRRLLREIDRREPAVAVLIDFPDFNFRLARQLHMRGIPIVYFVSPQLWAWRPKRIELVKKYVSKMLVIFPFEERWYRERAVQAEYVGHPLASLLAEAHSNEASRKSYAQKWRLDPRKQWIALLPGSRMGEVARNLPEMLTITRQIPGEYVLPVAPTLDTQTLTKTLADITNVHLVDDAGEALRHARAAVVASGTATVEAALIGTPMVVVYRVSPLTWKLGRKLVKLEHFAMPNLIAGRRIVPELIQEDFTAENVVCELNRLLADGPDRAQMLKDLTEVRARLAPTGAPPAERAATAVLPLLSERRRTAADG